MIKTKKEANTVLNWAEITLGYLKEAQANPLYANKTELEPTIFQLQNYKAYKIIQIVVGKLFMEFPLTKEEYEEYKILERKYWGLN